MHFMEGSLPIEWCIFWAVLSAPFIIYGIWKLTVMIKENRRVLPLLAVSGAFIFVICALPVETPVGCSHVTGTGLSTAFFGPGITSVLGLIVVLLQALLLGHGGLTTLGATVFSLGIAGPFAAWFVFKGMRKAGKAGLGISIFIAALVANLVTCIVASLQFALAYSDFSSFAMFMSSCSSLFITSLLGYSFIQVPLAFIDGIICALIAKYIVRIKPEILKTLGVIKDDEIAKIQGEAEKDSM